MAALDLAPYERSERRALWLTIALGLVTVVTAGLAAWGAARHSLRLVRQMVRRADDWREHETTGRFDLGPPVDEITELGTSLDKVLDRIASTLQSERRLTDEVAHELRNPLAVIRSEADLALPAADPPQAVSLRSIVAATKRMDAAITTMLAVARSSYADHEGCDASDVLESVAHQVAGRSEVALTIDRVATPLTIDAPQAIAVAALSPLVENAVRFAGRHVGLSATRTGRRVVVTVSDDGPGVAAERLDDIFRPGHSLSQHDGAGLGLALSRRLASSVGAEVRAHAVGHGLFELDLPAS